MNLIHLQATLLLDEHVLHIYIISSLGHQPGLHQNNRCMTSLQTYTFWFSRVQFFKRAHCDQSAGTASSALLRCLRSTTCAADFKALPVSVFSAQHKRELEVQFILFRATGDSSVSDQTVEPDADAPAGQSNAETLKHATGVLNYLLR